MRLLPDLEYDSPLLNRALVHGLYRDIGADHRLAHNKNKRNGRVIMVLHRVLFHAQKPAAARWDIATCLLATTALTFIGLGASTAQAQTQPRVQPVQVTIGGFFSQFLSYVDQDNVASAGVSGNPAKVDVTYDSEIHFNGRISLDNGVVIGFRVELEGNTDSDHQQRHQFHGVVEP
jgi:hypothetical protein